MLETRYQVWLLDEDGNRIHVFSGLGGEGNIRNIEAEVLLNDVGRYRIELNIPAIQSAEMGDITTEELVDSQVLLMRYDPLVDTDWTEVYRGFHRGLAYELAEDGSEMVASLGRHVNDLLASEPIRYPHGNRGACKSGPAESVAKRYVHENIGCAALPAERVRTGVEVEPDGETGARWEGCRGDRNLLEVVQEIADAAPADFMMVPTGGASFRFEWRADHWGVDRRPGNAEGNVPMVFAPRHGNCRRVEYLEDYQDEANVVYLLGPGQGSLRRVLQLTTEGATRTRWSRRAISRDGRRAADDVELQGIGVAELVGHRPVEIYTITVMQSEGTRWGRDWDLGDLVAAEHRGQRVDQQIIGWRLIVTEAGEELYALGAELREDVVVTTTSTSTTTTTSTSTSTTTSTTTSATLTSTSTSRTTTNTRSMSISQTRSDTTTTSTTSLSTSVTTVSMSISITVSYSTSTSTSTTTSTSTSTTSSSTSTLMPLDCS